MQHPMREDKPNICECKKYSFPRIASLKVFPENLKFAISKLELVLLCPNCGAGCLVELAPSPTGDVRSN